jgi:hypothetical protein
MTGERAYPGILRTAMPNTFFPHKLAGAGKTILAYVIICPWLFD